MLGPEEIKKNNLETPPAAPVIPPAGDIVSSFVEEDEYAKSKIAEILGEDPSKAKEDYKRQAILDYVKSKGAKTLEDVLWEVRYIANHVGTPGYGESRLNYIYEYVYLLTESKNIESKLKKMEVFNA
jgi:hypothetical protein